jgi:hypothetical protein
MNASYIKQFTIGLKVVLEFHPGQGCLFVVLQVVPAMKDGLVADWDVVESLWDHALRYPCDSRLSHFFVPLVVPFVEYSGLLVSHSSRVFLPLFMFCCAV